VEIRKDEIRRRGKKSGGKNKSGKSQKNGVNPEKNWKKHKNRVSKYKKKGIKNRRK